MIGPQQFIEAFRRVACEREDELIAQWKNLNNIMLDLDSGVLARVAGELGLKYAREYWTLDAVMFGARIAEYFPKDSTFAEQLSVGIEHENVATHAHSELVKLAMINCPLRVLFTYPGGTGGERLCEFANVLRRGDVFKDFGTLRKTMVVFGRVSQRHPVWTWNLFDGQDFQTLAS